MAKAAETLESLAEQARRKHLPRRHELVAVALDIGAEAMEHEREWFGKDGDHIGSSRDPQFTAANRSVEVAAGLALKFERPEEAADDMQLDDFAEQVDAAGMTDLLVSKFDEIRRRKAEQKAPEGAKIQ